MYLKYTCGHVIEPSSNLSDTFRTPVTPRPGATVKRLRFICPKCQESEQEKRCVAVHGELPSDPRRKCPYARDNHGNRIASPHGNHAWADVGGDGRGYDGNDEEWWEQKCVECGMVARGERLACRIHWRVAVLVAIKS